MLSYRCTSAAVRVLYWDLNKMDPAIAKVLFPSLLLPQFLVGFLAAGPELLCVSPDDTRGALVELALLHAWVPVGLLEVVATIMVSKSWHVVVRVTVMSLHASLLS